MMAFGFNITLPVGGIVPGGDPPAREYGIQRIRDGKFYHPGPDTADLGDRWKHFCYAPFTSALEAARIAEGLRAAGEKVQVEVVKRR